MPKEDTGEAVHVEFEGDKEPTEKEKEKMKGKLKDVAEGLTTVVVIHKPTGKNTYGRVKVKEVRRYAERAVQQFKASKPESRSRNIAKSDFYVIEMHDDGTVKVTTLE